MSFPLWSSLLLSIGVLIPLVVLLLYPAALWLLTRRRPRPEPVEPSPLPTVSLLVAVRNGERLVRDKVENSLRLDYPSDRLNLVLVSDGSTDGTPEALRELGEHPRVHTVVSEEHAGKAAALNLATCRASGDILVFTDVDALLEPDAVRRLVRHFSDPGVGGVCGARRIARDRASAVTAQKTYIDWDRAIKTLESRLGSITSNDGKLYAIRRELFRDIEAGATDDLYTALNVVAQGRRFVFEPTAVAFVRAPSRSPGHEIRRRRRIVARSLWGLFLMRQVLNPLRYGWFAAGLLVNKVLRRLLPLSLCCFVAGVVPLALAHSLWLVLLSPFAAWLLLVGSYGVRSRFGAASRIEALAVYVLTGNLGTVLGFLDWIMGRRFTKWNPLKA